MNIGHLIIFAVCWSIMSAVPAQAGGPAQVCTLAASDAPTGTAEWLSILFYILGGTVSVVGLFKMLRKPEGMPQPLIVAPGDKWATDGALSRVATETKRTFEAQASRIAEVVEKIHEVDKNLADVDGRTEQYVRTTSERLTIIERDIKEILQRLPRTR